MTYCLPKHGFVIVLKTIGDAKHWHQTEVDFSSQALLFLLGPFFGALVDGEDTHSLILMDGFDGLERVASIRGHLLLLNALVLLNVRHDDNPSLRDEEEVVQCQNDGEGSTYCSFMSPVTKPSVLSRQHSTALLAGATSLRLGEGAGAPDTGRFSTR